MFGMKTESKTHDLVIMKGKQFWSANLIENTGHKGNLPYYEEMAKMTENMTEAEKQKMGRDILEGFGGEIIGTENVLGNKCEVVKMMGAKCWIYKGVTLKSDAKLLGIKVMETAVKFDKNISVSKSKFTPPSNIQYQDQHQNQQQMFGGMDAGNFDDGDYGDDDDEMNLIPVKYPYSKFEKLANEFNYNNYRKLMVMNTNGAYSAMFMKGMNENLAVAATSRKNGNPGQIGNLENFTYKGKKCMYGKMDDDISLIVDISKYDTYIIFVSSSVKSKNEMLSILDEFNF